MGQMARAIGKTSNAVAFGARVELAKTAFQKTLFDEEAEVYRDGVATDHSSMHANFFPLAFGLVPEDKITGVLDWLSIKEMKSPDRSKSSNPFGANRLCFSSVALLFPKERLALQESPAIPRRLPVLDLDRRLA